jgi:hypothetical protein
MKVLIRGDKKRVKKPGTKRLYAPVAFGMP